MTTGQPYLHVATTEVSVERAKVLGGAGGGAGADLGKESKNGYTARDWAQLEKKEDVKTNLQTVIRQRGIEIRELVEEGRRRRSSRRSSSRSRTKRRTEGAKS